MLDNNSVSLRDIIKQVLKLIQYLISKWIFIAIVGIVGGVLGIIYAVFSRPTYSATTSFVLSTSNSNGNGLLGLASQFGVNLDNGSDNIFSGDNIISLIKSRRMLQQAMFTKPVNSTETLLNIYIRDNKINDGWIKNDKLKNAYPFPDDPSKMNMQQDSLFRLMYASIQDKLVDITKPENYQSIYELTIKSTNDTISYYLSKNLVEATSTFYINTKTSVSKENLSMLQNEADSMRRVLGSAITSVGSQNDLTFNLNPAYQVQRSGALQSQASATALGQAYAEVLRNLEIAKITLQKDTPLYQIIDAPTLPLTMDKSSKTICGLVGGFLGGIFICFVLVLIKLLKSFKLN